MGPAEPQYWTYHIPNIVPKIVFTKCLRTVIWAYTPRIYPGSKIYGERQANFLRVFCFFIHPHESWSYRHNYDVVTPTSGVNDKLTMTLGLAHRCYSIGKPVFLVSSNFQLHDFAAQKKCVFMGERRAARKGHVSQTALTTEKETRRILTTEKEQEEYWQLKRKQENTQETIYFQHFQRRTTMHWLAPRESVRSWVLIPQRQSGSLFILFSYRLPFAQHF